MSPFYFITIQTSISFQKKSLVYALHTINIKTDFDME